MKLGIRAKVVGVLLLAAALPLLLGLASLYVLGYRDYRARQGDLFQSRARNLAQRLGDAIDVQIDSLHDWVTLSELARLTAARAREQQGRPESPGRDGAAELDARWPNLARTAPEVHAALSNAVAEAVGRFLALNPLVAELIVTDEEGRLLAASNKTTDYWQSDEAWWQQAITLPARQVVVEGVIFDESAGVHAIDVSMPIRISAAGAPVGVVKAVINVSPLFAEAGRRLPPDGANRTVVTGDGLILVRPRGAPVSPLKARINPDAMRRMAAGREGWAVLTLAGQTEELCGFAPLASALPAAKAVRQSGLLPMLCVVHSDFTTVMHPVIRQLRLTALLGGVAVVLFMLAGLYLTGRALVRPIDLLRQAAHAIARGARLREEGATPPAGPDERPERLVERLKALHTGDEVEALAGDFALMANRVLSYHEHLEAEIARRTEEMQVDMAVAREFQEALLPREYPLIPDHGGTARLGLNFHHVYKPAASVGGDFFDVIKLDANRAGIFIADVMGHGARSALITAILRTLMQNLAHEAHDPAAFLRGMNRHFLQVLPQKADCIFATAFYLVVDVEHEVANWCCAGHPAPLRVDRRRREVLPLLVTGRGGPALGLKPDAVYVTHTTPIAAGDLFFLYTDGVTEACNPRGEVFGEPRLADVLAAHLDLSADDLSSMVVTEINRFMDTAMAADDICMVAAEVVSVAAAKPPPPA